MARPFPGAPGPGGTRSAAQAGPGGHRGGRAPCPERGFTCSRPFTGFGEAFSAFTERTRVAAINFAPSFVPKRAGSKEQPGPGGINGGSRAGAGPRPWLWLWLWPRLRLWLWLPGRVRFGRVRLGGFVRLTAEVVLLGSHTNTDMCSVLREPLNKALWETTFSFLNESPQFRAGFAERNKSCHEHGDRFGELGIAAFCWKRNCWG